MTPIEVGTSNEIFQYVDNYDLFGKDSLTLSKMVEKQKSTEKIKREMDQLRVIYGRSSPSRNMKNYSTAGASRKIETPRNDPLNAPIDEIADIKFDYND